MTWKYSIQYTMRSSADLEYAVGGLVLQTVGI